MTNWAALEKELNIWRDEGQVATFWWRDDDLNEPGDAFDRLLNLREMLDIPLSLAVIPDRVDPHIGDDLDGCLLLQHGVFHRNFAPENAKKSEFPENRSLEEMTKDLKEGKARMEELFGDRFFPFFVPPWNRITDTLFTNLASIGFIGLSRYHARRSGQPVHGLAEINTHIDPVFWRGDRSALDEESILEMVLSHLQARRTGLAEKSEPTGFLSHHLVHDEVLWEITFKLLSFLKNHEAVRWLTLPAALAFIDDFIEDP